MDSEVKLFIERAENELRLAAALFNLSDDEKIKVNLEANPNDTFYSAVISHAYYSIFYAAKSLLLTKKINTKAPEVHKKTFDEFKKEFVDSGILDMYLFEIYEKMIVRADELLQLYHVEKSKRGTFTYHTISQANIPPAKESLHHAKTFIKNIKNVLEKGGKE